MGKWNDWGIGAIGLIRLAAALSLVATIGIPVADSTDAVEPTDWLGLAGNVLGASVVLLAAIIAWRQVQPRKQ